MVEKPINQLKTSQQLPLRRDRQGAALLFCMFVIGFMTLMVINVLDSTTLEIAALRNEMDYERALYLANAGVHAVAAQLEADETWTGTITDGLYPADDTYEAVAVANGSYAVTVTSTGVSGSISRTVQAEIEL